MADSTEPLQDSVLGNSKNTLYKEGKETYGGSHEGKRRDGIYGENDSEENRGVLAKARGEYGRYCTPREEMQGGMGRKHNEKRSEKSRVKDSIERMDTIGVLSTPDPTYKTQPCLEPNIQMTEEVERDGRGEGERDKEGERRGEGDKERERERKIVDEESQETQIGREESAQDRVGAVYNTLSLHHHRTSTRLSCLHTPRQQNTFAPITT